MIDRDDCDDEESIASDGQDNMINKGENTLGQLGRDLPENAPNAPANLTHILPSPGSGGVNDTPIELEIKK